MSPPADRSSPQQLRLSYAPIVQRTLAEFTALEQQLGYQTQP